MADLVCACQEEFRSVCEGLPADNEHEGKQYCALHAPTKDKNLVEVGEAIKKKFRDKDFDFRGVYFPRDYFSSAGIEELFAGISDANWAGLPQATLDRFSQRSVFEEEADFSNATFEGERADFSDAHFKRGANFSEATFEEEADFSGVIFEEGADFSNATFEGCASFATAAFGEWIWGRVPPQTYDTAKEWTYFSGATFKKRTDFSNATFEGKTSFSEATFEGERADFTHAHFKKRADFSEAIFKKRANFPGAIFKKRADFSNATFEDLAVFSNATFEWRAEFLAAIFKEGAMFWFLKPSPQAFLTFRAAIAEKPGRVSFHTTHLRPSWFIDVDAQKFDFSDVVWFRLSNGKKLKLNQEIAAVETHYLHHGRSSSMRILQRACRKLMNNAEENRDYHTANEFHYWSMELLRKESWWRRLGLRGTLYWVYWALSGYGERPLRAFLFLVGLWAFFAFLYMVAGPSELKVFTISLQDVPSISAQGQSITDIWSAFVYSLGALTRLRPEPQPDGPGWFQGLVTAEGILGPLQIALLALALRRKFMR